MKTHPAVLQLKHEFGQKNKENHEMRFGIIMAVL
jgi:hypothetical protein